MRLLLLTILMSSMFAHGASADKGALLILKNVYVFPDVEQTGQRILMKKREAYDVIDIRQTAKGDMLFRVKVPTDENMINGSGFIMETETELERLGTDTIKVYPEVPTLHSNLTDFQPVPAHHLSSTGVQKQSPDFPHILWRAVNYQTPAPYLYWVADWAGIYRPDKTADWVNRIYEEIQQHRLKAETRRKILMGLVETGFSEDQVRMAYGQPAHVRQVAEENKIEWIYDSRKVIFKNRQVLQVL